MQNELAGLKILIATAPADGHFYPLTGIAKFLQLQGCDVRWYSSKHYGEKLEKLSIPFYPYKKALDVDISAYEDKFPQRKQIKSLVKKLNFDLEHFFIRRGPEYFQDIRDINAEFDFDVMLTEVAFTGTPFVKDLIHKKIVSVGIIPITLTSKNLPPTGLGLTPSYSVAGPDNCARPCFVSLLIRLCSDLPINSRIKFLRITECLLITTSYSIFFLLKQT